MEEWWAGMGKGQRDRYGNTLHAVLGRQCSRRRRALTGGGGQPSQEAGAKARGWWGSGSGLEAASVEAKRAGLKAGRFHRQKLVMGLTTSGFLRTLRIL